MRRKWIATVLALGLVAAACGGDDEAGGAADTGDQTSTSAGSGEPANAGSGAEGTAAGGEDDAAVDPDGVLRMAYDVASSSVGGLKWDPAENLTSTAGLGLYHWVYGGLMRPEPDGTLVPDLAESMNVLDENTLEIVLREGLTLPDGRAFDAQTVKQRLDSNLANTDTPAFAVEFYNLENVEVTSPTSLELTIPNGTAAGWADMFLAGMETVIVPPDTDLSQPAGAGPYRVVDFVPEERVVLEKNPDYWNAESIQVQRIELINAPDTRSQASALNADQVDWARLDSGTLDAVEGSGFEIIAEPNGDMLTAFPICKETEPFDDPKVRRALNMAIDREAINQALFDGNGEVAWDVWPEDHRFHNPDLTDYYAYDPEAARQLLEEAGHGDGFTFEMIPIPSSGMPETAQIVQQQFAEIGVTMEIRQTTNYSEDVHGRRLVPMSLVPTLASPGIGKMRQWVGESAGNMCHYDDPELNQVTQELMAVSRESDEAVELWHQAQKIVVEDALSILMFFQPRITAYDPEALGDVTPAGYVVPVPDVYNLFVKG